ncbi:MAG: penicillin-binding transpeptidase domain-containing protein, partial [Nitrospirota bacterium]
AEEKLISRGQESKAAAQAIILKNLREGEEVAPYLVEQIRLYLESKYGVQKVYMEGLNVKTTINYGMQKAAAAAVESGVRDLDKRQGWRGPLAKRDPKEIDRLEDDTGVKQSAFHPGEIVTATVLKVDDNGAAISARGCKGYISSADMRWASGRDGKKKPPQILMPGYVIEARVKGSGKKGMTFSLEQEPISQGALVALDPWEGKVKAMVGGVDFQKSEFNHAVYAHRQPGSAFKPFVYAAAMESGFTPASIINDEPRSYDDDKWKPANYDREYYGPTRLREALVHSRNVVTIELLHEVGVNKVISLAKSLGMDGPFAGNLTLALGSGSVTPLELTAAYAVFANGGYKVTPITITEVTDRRGKVIESNGTSVEQALSFSTTYQVTSMLEDAVKRGTGQLATILGRPVAGKTGTTNDYKDAWFVGYTPYLVAGVWVGNDDQKPLGHGESGSRAALPIWVRFMSNAQTAYPPDGFTIPDEIEFVDVDSETGLLPTAACKEVVLECFKKGTAPHEYAQSIPEVRKETVPAAATESAPVTEDKKKRLLQDVD